MSLTNLRLIVLKGFRTLLHIVHLLKPNFDILIYELILNRHLNHTISLFSQSSHNSKH